MIKLTQRHPDERHTVIQVEGRLDSETVPELERLVTGVNCSAQITLDLSGLTSLDQEGRGALLRLRSAGRRVLGASLYVGRLLEEAQQ